MLGKVIFIFLLAVRQEKCQCVNLGNSFKEELNLELQKFRISLKDLVKVSSLRGYKGVKTYQKENTNEGGRIQMIKFEFRDRIRENNYLFRKFYFMEE